MKISINENSALEGTEIIINCQKTDEEILRILSTLRAFDKKLTGVKNGEMFILEANQVLYFDTVDKKTFIYTQNEVLETPLRLYELEERFAGSDFFRSSKSAIVNISKIKSIKPEFGGRLEITLINGEKLYISRQYVPEFKHRLGL